MTVQTYVESKPIVILPDSVYTDKYGKTYKTINFSRLGKGIQKKILPLKGKTTIFLFKDPLMLKRGQDNGSWQVARVIPEWDDIIYKPVFQAHRGWFEVVWDK